MAVNENPLPGMRNFKAHFMDPLLCCFYRDFARESRLQCRIVKQCFVDSLAEIHCVHIQWSLHCRVCSHILHCLFTKLFICPQNSTTYVGSVCFQGMYHCCFLMRSVRHWRTVLSGLLTILTANWAALVWVNENSLTRVEQRAWSGPSYPQSRVWTHSSTKSCKIFGSATASVALEELATLIGTTLACMSPASHSGRYSLTTFDLQVWSSLLHALSCCCQTLPHSLALWWHSWSSQNEKTHMKHAHQTMTAKNHRCVIMDMWSHQYHQWCHSP